MYKDNNDYGYLQHSTAGKPMRTERVLIKNDGAGQEYRASGTEAGGTK